METPGWDGVERRVAKRRTKHQYRFLERRHGFDRRKRYPVFGTMRDNPWMVVAIIVLLNLMSLTDGVLTAGELGLGIAFEANPVLDAAAKYGPLYAAGVKVAAMVVVSVIIWKGRRRRSILMISVLSLIVFTALLAYHFGSLHGYGWL